jgi:hypothetical protein
MHPLPIARLLSLHWAILRQVEHRNDKPARSLALLVSFWV